MAIKLKDLCIDFEESILGSNLLLIGEGKVYNNYREGVKVGPGGISYPCLSEKLGFEKIDIKVPGTTIPQIVFDGKPIPVKFEGLEGKAWQDFSAKGEIKLSLTAKSIVSAVSGNKENLKMNIGGNKG